MSTLPTYDLAAVRAEFPISQRVTYLNHAGVSPLPLPARRAHDFATDGLVMDPAGLFGPQPPDGETIFAAFSNTMAVLIHAASPREIVTTGSTSTALNTVAQAIDWQPGDNILVCDVEFPSNVYPWQALARRGVEVRLVPADEGGASVAAFEPYVDARTRLIAVSAVQFFTGHRADLGALGAFCRSRGILFSVDAIQAAGHIPIDVQAMQIDILASGGQKSLMGPMGQGFLYVRDEVAERMQPAMVGPNATVGWEHWLAYDLTPLPGAARFMPGTINMVGMFALVASVRFLMGLGVPHIDAWTRHLSQLAIEDLDARGWRVITPRDPDRLGPIVTFYAGTSAEADALIGQLKARGIIVVKHLDRAGAGHIRISTHCYNTEEEVLRVGEALADCARQGMRDHSSPSSQS